MTLFKKILCIYIFFGSSSLFSGQITFSVNGVNSDKGMISAQLFYGEEDYLLGKPLQKVSLPAKKTGVIFIFPNLVNGSYGIRYFHDENSNSELETNLFGIPVEGYGFSNNAKPNFGPALYQDLQFHVEKDEDNIINDSQVIY